MTVDIIGDIMTKVVINACYGGFSLSEEAIDLFLNKKGLPFTKEKGEYFSLCGHTYNVNGEEYWSDRDIERNDPVLIEVVQELGEKANGRCAELSIVEVPDDAKWHIAEYDGYEHVAENHRTWS